MDPAAANPYERGILLPPGCKDITDSYRRERPKPEFRVGGLDLIYRFVTKVCETRARRSSLTVKSMDARVTVILERDSPHLKLYPMAPALERERDIDEFFVQRGIRPFIDQVSGAVCRPTRILGFRLSLAPSGVADLIADLLECVYALAIDSEIQFLFAEGTAPRIIS